MSDTFESASIISYKESHDLEKLVLAGEFDKKYNIYDMRINPCVCGSTDVYMRKSFATHCLYPFSLKCNHCKREQNWSATWDVAVSNWNFTEDLVNDNS